MQTSLPNGTWIVLQQRGVPQLAVIMSDPTDGEQCVETGRLPDADTVAYECKWDGDVLQSLGVAPAASVSALRNAALEDIRLQAQRNRPADSARSKSTSN